jgi:hypothetical protein
MINLQVLQRPQYFNIVLLPFVFFIFLFLISETFGATIPYATANATGEAMTQANNLVNMASSAGSNATQTAMDQTQNILTNVTNNLSNTASNATANATGEAVNEANELINAASKAGSNATEMGMNQARNTMTNVSNNVSSTTSNVTSNLIKAPLNSYSSNKYQIQFQYPSDWEFNEKTNRFEEGTDIRIRSFEPPGFSLITVGRLDDLTSTSGSNDLITGFYELYKQAITDYTKEISVIEQPSFINIDGQKAGTFLITQKDKYEDTALRLANQVWLVYVGGHGYLISFVSTTDQFDSPKNVKIRDDFIKSINFLGTNNQTSTNTTNRFD